MRHYLIIATLLFAVHLCACRGEDARKLPALVEIQAILGQPVESEVMKNFLKKFELEMTSEVETKEKLGPKLDRIFHRRNRTYSRWNYPVLVNTVAHIREGKEPTDKPVEQVIRLTKVAMGLSPTNAVFRLEYQLTQCFLATS